jgi:hypothetical protein
LKEKNLYNYLILIKIKATTLKDKIMSEKENDTLPSLKKETEKLAAQLPAQVEAWFGEYLEANPEMATKLEKGEVSVDSLAQLTVAKLVIKMSKEAVESLHNKSEVQIEVKTVATLEQFIEKIIEYGQKTYPEHPELGTQFLQGISKLELDKLPQTITSVMNLGVVPERGFVGYTNTLEKEELWPLIKVQKEIIFPIIKAQILESLPKELDDTLDSKGFVDSMLEEIFELIHGKDIPLSSKESKFYDDLKNVQEIYVNGKKMTATTAQKNLTKIMDEHCNVDNLKNALFDRIKSLREVSDNNLSLDTTDTNNKKNKVK